MNQPIAEPVVGSESAKRTVESPIAPGTPAGRFRLGLFISWVGWLAPAATVVVALFVIAIEGLENAPSRSLVAAMLVSVVVGEVLVVGGGLFARSLPADNAAYRSTRWLLVLVVFFAIFAILAAVTIEMPGASTWTFGALAVIHTAAVGLWFWMMRQAGFRLRSPATVGLAGWGLLIHLVMTGFVVASRVFDARPGYDEIGVLFQPAAGIALATIGLWLPWVAFRACRHGVPQLVTDAEVASGVSAGRQWAWFGIGAGVSSVVVAAVAAFYLLPVSYDRQFFEDVYAPYRVGASDDELAWEAYAKLPVSHSFYDRFEEFTQRWRNRNGVVLEMPVHDPEARDELETSGLVAAWDAAMARPIAVVPVNLSPTFAWSSDPVDLISATQTRILATIGDPDAFVETVSAVRHAVVMLQTGDVIDAATGTSAGHHLITAIAIHLQVARDSITPAQIARIDADLQAIAAGEANALNSIVLNKALYPRMLENEVSGPLRDSTVASGYLTCVQGVRAEIEQNRMSAAEWRTLAPGRRIDPYADIGLIDRLRIGPHGMFKASSGISFFDHTVGGIRALTTRARLARIALRVEAWRAAHAGQLPRTLDDIEADGHLLKDEWAGDGSRYVYAILNAPGTTTPGYEVGSVGRDGRWTAGGVPDDFARHPVVIVSPLR